MSFEFREKSFKKDRNYNLLFQYFDFLSHKNHSNAIKQSSKKHRNIEKFGFRELMFNSVHFDSIRLSSAKEARKFLEFHFNN